MDNYSDWHNDRFRAIRLGQELRKIDGLIDQKGAAFRTRLDLIRESLFSEVILQPKKFREEEVASFSAGFFSEPDDIQWLIEKMQTSVEGLYHELKSLPVMTQKQTSRFAALIFVVGIMIHPYVDGNGQTFSILALSYINELLTGDRKYLNSTKFGLLKNDGEELNLREYKSPINEILASNSGVFLDRYVDLIKDINSILRTLNNKSEKLEPSTLEILLEDYINFKDDIKLQFKHDTELIGRIDTILPDLSVTSTLEDYKKAYNHFRTYLLGEQLGYSQNAVVSGEPILEELSEIFGSKIKTSVLFENWRGGNLGNMQDFLDLFLSPNNHRMLLDYILYGNNIKATSMASSYKMLDEFANVIDQNLVRRNEYEIETKKRLRDLKSS